MIRTIYASRWLLIALAFAVLFVIAPVSAQSDVDVLALQVDVRALQIQAVELRGERAKEKEVLAADLAKIRGDVTQLQAQVRKANADIGQLQSEVAQLKTLQPANGQSLTLRAPFTVKDATGRIAFQVDVPVERNLPRAIVGNPAGSACRNGTLLRRRGGVRVI